MAGSKTLRNVNASEIKPRKKLLKKIKNKTYAKNITGKISINVFIDGTKSGLRCFYFAALSLSFLQSQSLPLSRWRERERSVTSTLQPLIAWLYQAAAALAAAVDAIRDRAPTRSTTRAVAAAAAKDKQQ